MQSFLHAIRTTFGVFLDGLTFISLCFRPMAALAAENLFLRKQLGLYVERNVKPPQRPADPKQRWMTFVRNHAKAIIACDFFVVVTATFQLVYVFFIMEIGTRRLLHFNVTRHPTADWTLQQFRECVTGDEGYRF